MFVAISYKNLVRVMGQACCGYCNSLFRVFGVVGARQVDCEVEIAVIG